MMLLPFTMEQHRRKLAEAEGKLRQLNDIEKAFANLIWDLPGVLMP